MNNNKPIISVNDDVYRQVGGTLNNNNYAMNSKVSTSLETTPSTTPEEVIQPTYVDPVKELKETMYSSNPTAETVDTTPQSVYDLNNPPAELTSTPTMFEYQNNNDAIENEIINNDYNVDGPIITTHSATDIISNYNHIDDMPIDDNQYLTVEQQLAYSKDIDFNVQQPKKRPELEDYTPAEPMSLPNESNTLPNQTMPAYLNSMYDSNSNSPFMRNSIYPNVSVAKSEFASRPGETETNVDRKIKKETRKFNFVLLIIYALIIGVVGFVGYNYYIKSNDFYLGKTEINLAQGSSYEDKIYRKGVVEDSKDFTFTSADDNIASVDSKGVIKGNSEGTTTITVKSNKTKKSKVVTVKVINVVIKDFTTDFEERTVALGNNVTITPIINNQSDITMDLVWTSSDESVAKVTNTGVIQPIKEGRTIITVSVPNTEHSATIEIVVVKK